MALIRGGTVTGSGEQRVFRFFAGPSFVPVQEMREEGRFCKGI